jgi:hypothetical protein
VPASPPARSQETMIATTNSMLTANAALTVSVSRSTFAFMSTSLFLRCTGGGRLFLDLGQAREVFVRLMLDRAGGLAAKRHEGARIDRNASGLERLGQLAFEVDH